MKLLNKLFYIIVLVFAGCNAPHKTTTPPGATNNISKPSPPNPALNAVGITKPELLKAGYTSMDDYIKKNVKYPEAAKKNNIEGTIMVSATLDTLGVLRDVKADNDLGYGTAAAAEKVVQSMSPMSPAGNNGKLVRFHMKVPVNFTLTKQFTNDSEKKLEKIYQNMPDFPAQFPGGDEERDKFIRAHLKLPASVTTEGAVLVKADVKISGALSHVRVVKPGIPELDAEAIRVVRAMPKWKPAETLGHPVKSQVVIPVEMKR